MIVIAASCPSNRLAAVTKRTGCTGACSADEWADGFGWVMALLDRCSGDAGWQNTRTANYMMSTECDDL
ncbi:hypothetical protein GCM10010170_023090 [Dactylosporangium salmoneum]|uniref:Uncharacterized protein n=1 Tax=Dactylosporangium salmoneum TaxID=53361 RepID=A0ABP5SWC9_9ACTN